MIGVKNRMIINYKALKRLIRYMMQEEQEFLRRFPDVLGHDMHYGALVAYHNIYILIIKTERNYD